MVTIGEAAGRARRDGIGWLTAYAIAMAQVEAALVIYLRRLYYADDPLTLFPLTMMPNPDLATEVARELATIVMIAGVAFLHAKRGTRVFAAFLYVFGLWDIAYYGWLKLMLGWPTSWLEWDVLFLIPWPLLGPWLAAIASAAGAAIVVGTFLLPGWPFVTGTVPNAGYRPAGFRWEAFALGHAVMTAGLFAIGPPRRRT